jgi:hypothetical protein
LKSQKGLGTTAAVPALALDELLPPPPAPAATGSVVRNTMSPSSPHPDVITPHRPNPSQPEANQAERLRGNGADGIVSGADGIVSGADGIVSGADGIVKSFLESEVAAV